MLVACRQNQCFKQKKHRLHNSGTPDRKFKVIDDNFEQCHEKTCLWGFQQGLTQTGLHNHRRSLQAWNLGFR